MRVARPRVFDGREKTYDSSTPFAEPQSVPPKNLIWTKHYSKQIMGPSAPKTIYINIGYRIRRLLMPGYLLHLPDGKVT
jgi:hypothetical protein